MPTMLCPATTKNEAGRRGLVINMSTIKTHPKNKTTKNHLIFQKLQKIHAALQKKVIFILILWLLFSNFQFLNLKMFVEFFVGHHNTFSSSLTVLSEQFVIKHATTTPPEHIQRWSAYMECIYLAWSACHKDDCPPSPVVRNAYKTLLGKNWWWCKNTLTRPLW